MSADSFISIYWTAWRGDLRHRLLYLTLLFILETVVITIYLDSYSLLKSSGLAAFIAHWGYFILRCLVASGIIFWALLWLTAGQNGLPLSDADGRAGASLPYFLTHLASLGAFAVLSAMLFGHWWVRDAGNLVAAAWFLTGLTAAALGCCAVLRPSGCVALIRRAGRFAVYAAVAGIAATALGQAATLWMQPLTRLTFAVARMLLLPFLPDVTADPVKLTIGSPRFSVLIRPECAGFEGAGLMLAFAVTWLFLFRREYRFPHALLLVPAGTAVLWLVNAARIAALILIGNAGAPHLALGGFHSQAGWIAFNATALGTVILGRRIPWFTWPDRRAARDSAASTAADSAVPYLAPFLAILAAGMLSQAAAAGFEWFYPLRVVAAVAVFWSYRRVYREMDWRFGAIAPAAGILVFLLWILLGPRGAAAAGSAGIPAALTSSTAGAAGVWIAFRAVGGIVTVPLAEELAFRGFLFRRAISADFESASWTKFPYFALAISAFAFGLLHGRMWPAGILAGLIYGAVYARRRRIGDAVVAHATTNALLAAAVVASGNWSYW